MKFFILVIGIVLSSLSCAHERYAFQAGITGQTLTGAYIGSTTYKTLSENGNLGIGTINNISGEMVLIDDKFFVTKDKYGHTYSPDLSESTPFAIVTNFTPDCTFSVSEIPNREQFINKILNHVNSDNNFLAIRVDGEFNRVIARSISKNSNSKEKNLKEYIKKYQHVNKYKNINGTLVIFRSPEFAYPMTVPGYHIHFISSDHKLVGHVYDFNIKKAITSIEVIHNYHVELPNNSEFLEHNYVGNLY